MQPSTVRCSAELFQCKEGELHPEQQPESPAEEPGRHGPEAERHAGTAREGHQQAADHTGAEQQQDQRPAEGGKESRKGQLKWLQELMFLAVCFSSIFVSALLCCLHLTLHTKKLYRSLLATKPTTVLPAVALPNVRGVSDYCLTELCLLPLCPAAV